MNSQFPYMNLKQEIDTHDSLGRNKMCWLRPVRIGRLSQEDSDAC